MVITEEPSASSEERDTKEPESVPKSTLEDDRMDDDSSDDDSRGSGSDGSNDASEASDPSVKNIAEGEEGKAKLERKDSSSSDDVKYSFLAIAQRMTEVVNRNQLHPFSHRVFGTPLLLRVRDLEGYSGRDLYDLIGKRIRNFVPKSALRFLVDDNEALTEEPSEMEGTYAKAKRASRQRRQRTTSEMEVVTAGPVPRYGFRLRITTRDARRCALCPWYECCIGCLIPDDDYPTIAVCGDSIVLDWHFAVDIATSGFGLRKQTEGIALSPALRARTTGVTVKNHSTCDSAKKKGFAGAITLEDCLDSFAKEERIPEVSQHRFGLVLFLDVVSLDLD